MLITYKTEIEPTDTQAWMIDRHIGASRWAYNLFLDINQQRYETGYHYMNAYEFSKWFNSVYLDVNPDDKWIKEIYAKSTKQAFIDADTAMKRFFKHISKHPRFKSYKRSQGSYYFVKNSKNEIIQVERHRIKLPKLGWVRLKEFGYIPTDSEHFTIKQGRIRKHAGKYYITSVVEQADLIFSTCENAPIGIDLGLKNFAILSSGTAFKNLNKSQRVRKLRKSLRRQQRKLSRQYLAFKQRKKLERNTTDFNLAKTQLKVRKLYHKLASIQDDYQKKVVSDVVRTKPQYVAIEDLNVKGMMKNRALSKAVMQQGFYAFRTKLINKCQQLGIPVHLTNRFEPTSKLCHNCGYKLVDLKLKDRMYKCPECGYVKDRDVNASLNIRDTEHFELVY